MNAASILFFICYIPEFYANYVNKNANVYNVLDKVVMLAGTTLAFSYSVKINNQALIINYTPLFILDTIALFMRGYYAYKNKNRDVRMLSDADTHNPIQGCIEDYTQKYRQESKEYPDEIIDPL
jgi:hypothetical protein